MNLQKITIQGTLELQWPVSWGARCCRWRVTLRKGQPHTNLTALTVLACSVTQSCLTLCDPVDCSPSGSSVRGVFPARILGWIAIPFSRGSSWPRDRSRVSCIAGGFFPIWATRFSLIYELKTWLKINIHKTKTMASSPITSWEINGETMETVRDFILGGSKITADGDCSQWN